MSPLPVKFGLLLLLAPLAVAGVAGAKAAAAYRGQAEQFRRPRHRVELPPDAAELGLRRIELRLKDGVVRGWFTPSRNGAAIVFTHGSPSDRTEMLPEARALAHAGYGTVLFDVPGHGESAGSPTWGHGARGALRAVVDFLAAQPGIERIGAHGFSMGSALVAQVAAEDQRIKAAVLAGAFTTAEDQLRYEFRSWDSVTVLPALWAARRHGLAFEQLRTIDAVTAISARPLLFIGGTDDGVVPEHMQRRLYEAATGSKQLLMIPHGGHGNYADVLGEAYFEHLRSFFDASLLPNTHSEMQN